MACMCVSLMRHYSLAQMKCQIKLGMRTATTSSGRQLEPGHLFPQSLEQYSVAYSTSFKDSTTYHGVWPSSFQTRTSCITAPLGVRLELRLQLSANEVHSCKNFIRKISSISSLGRYEAKFALVLEVACLYRYLDWCIHKRFFGHNCQKWQEAL